MRILVDRLWPRGLSKERAKIDFWLKSVAPSDDLRKWYQHDHQKWLEFKKRYFEELNASQNAVTEFMGHLKGAKVSLLFSAKETQYNNAAALKEYISKLLK